MPPVEDDAGHGRRRWDSWDAAGWARRERDKGGATNDAGPASDAGTLVGKFTPTAPNDSQWLPMAPNDSRQLPTTTNTRCCWLPMTPTDFHLLPSRELTPQPYSKGGRSGHAHTRARQRTQRTRARPWCGRTSWSQGNMLVTNNVLFWRNVREI